MKTFAIGVDFAGPSLANRQRKKIIAVAARRIGARRYVVQADGFNARLTPYAAFPGWTASDLADAIVAAPELRVVSADFPFSLPRALLQSRDFAALVGRPRAFDEWSALAEFVRGVVPLEPPVDLGRFAPWREPSRRAEHWTKRATDVAANAQPPLKDKFQVLFNMTLLGIAMLARLRDAGFAIVPFDPPRDRRVLEVYPGVSMRRLRRANYKRDPKGAIDAMLEHCRARGVVIDVAPSVREFCDTYDSGTAKSPDPDGSDALIALCVGLLQEEGLAEEVIDVARVEARHTEGAIWAPTVRPLR